MQVKVLGSGTSIGIPMLGCSCAVCESTNPKNFRTRASIMLTNDKGQNLVIDTGPDFRTQMLREKIKKVDQVLYTHAHSDHANGLDDLRGFFFSHKTPIDCFVVESEIEAFENRFSYIFKQTGYLGSRAEIRLNRIPDEGFFDILDMKVETARLPHGNVKVSCFRFGSFLYATDFKTFPDELIERWKGKIEIMVASGPRFTQLPTHSSVTETIEVFQKLGVKRGIISHISHEIDHERDRDKLPHGVEFAYDGMTLRTK